VRFLLLFLFSTFIYASQDIKPTAGYSALQYQLFEDTTGMRSIAQIDKLISAVPILNESQHFGYSNSAFWIKLKLNNTSDRNLIRWLDLGAPRLQAVTLYQYKNGRWQHAADAGLDTPLSLHPLKAKQAVFALPLEQSVEVLIRLKSITSMSFSLGLWDPLAFRDKENAESLWAGGLLGAFMMVALCCICLFVFMRDVAFLYHGLAVFFFVLNEACMRGYGALYLWPESTIWSVHSLSFFGQVCTLFFLLFVRNFLNLVAFLPWGDKVLRLMLVWNFLAIIIAQCIDYQLGTMMGLLLILITVPVLLPMCLQLMSKGGLAIRYFAGGLLVLMSGNILRALDLLGLLASNQVLGEHYMLMVIVFSMLSFLMAIIDRVMLAKQGKESAQKTLIHTLNEQQSLLEKAVASRTLELTAAVEEAQTANRLKTKLLAYIGHDLRAPLSAMIASAKIMRKDESCHVFAGHIERSAGQQLELIDELLRFSHGEIVDDGLQLSIAYFDEFMLDISEQAKLLAGQYQNRFILLQQGAAPCCAWADWRRLRRVLQNLLSNAAKFTRYGVISLTTEWRWIEDQRGELKIVVDDTGLGINQADQARIFLPFERIESAELQEGHGLGLAIASQMVKSMGGELKVESALQRGCRFYFSLNLQSADASPTQHLPEISGPKLPLAVVQQLHGLIANGEVSELENWAVKIAGQSADHALLAAQIEEAIYLLDFTKLQALADGLVVEPATSPIAP
jgi:signal transduction histidine kinase